MSRSAKPRIVLIHALTIAIDPVQEAFRTGWPEAETVNLTEDSLSADLARDGVLTDAMIQRFIDLAVYGYARVGADAILFTCSAFGRAIEQAAASVPVPVLKPNEAMFEAAFSAGGSGRLGMVATFGPSVPSMEAEFNQDAARLRPGATLKTVVSEPAMAALRQGDAETHNRLVAEAARGLDGCDAILLAQFSTSRAAEATRAAVRVPVLTAPEAAVAKLKASVAAQ